MLTERKRASVSPRRPTHLRQGFGVQAQKVSVLWSIARQSHSDGQRVEGEAGGLAQLARAPALQAGGHRFDSDILHRQLATPIVIWELAIDKQDQTNVFDQKVLKR